MLRLKRVVLGVVASVLFLTSVAPVAKAEEAPATEMAQSMLTYFRTQNADIQVSRITDAELKVYGVFLSNFFVPYSTKLADMSETTTDTNLSKRVSEKFFGSSGNMAKVAEINGVISNAISDGLKDTANPFGLYATKADKTSGTVMSGNKLLDKIAGKDTDPLIYNAEGKAVLSIKDKATLAVFKVLYSISPDMFLGNKKGLRAMTSLHLDGVGNIWGKVDGASASDTVLFLPASLNPMVFTDAPNSDRTNMRFPMTNTFVMGSMISTDGSSLTSEKLGTPYYNALGSFPSARTADNLLTIYGVNSPAGYVGNSDAIFSGSAITESQVKSYLSSNVNSGFNKANAKIVVSGKIVGKDLFNHDKNAFPNEDYGKNLLGYLSTSAVFSMSGTGEVSDAMYYFNNPYLTGGYAKDEEGGDSSDDASLFIKQTLFYREGDTANTFRFYKGSSYLSPMADLMSKLSTATSETDKQTILKGAIKDFGDDGDFVTEKTKELLTSYKLGSFLGVKNFPSPNAALHQMMRTLLNESTLNSFIMLPKSVDGGKVSTDTVAFVFKGKTRYSGSFGENDSYIAKSVTGGKLTADDWKTIASSGYSNIDALEPYIQGSSTKDDTKARQTFTSLFHNFFVYDIFGMSSTFSRDLSGQRPSDGEIPSTWGEFKLNNTIANGVNNYMGIYWGYMVDIFKLGSAEETKTIEFKVDGLPYMFMGTLGGSFNISDILSTQGVSSSDKDDTEKTAKDLIKKLNSFLSDGHSVVRNAFFKSSQDGWFLTTHQSLVGSWSGNAFSVSAGANGGYTSVIGFVTTPSLHDLPLTAWLLNDYFVVYILGFILCFVVVLIMVLVNVRTVREGVILLLVLSFLLLSPQFLISSTINVTNSIGNKLFSERFSYWTIIQHKQSSMNLANAAQSGDSDEYIIATSINSANAIYSKDAGVRVKWMAPKRFNVFEELLGAKNTTQSISANLTIFKWLFSTTMTGDEYVLDDPLSTYIYRPYTTIASEAATMYSTMFSDSSFLTKADTSTTIKGEMKGVAGVPPERFAKLNGEGSLDLSTDQAQALKKAKPYLYSEETAEISRIEQYRFWGMSSDAVTSKIFNDNYESGNIGFTGQISSDANSRAFTLATESPYYYFYSALKSRVDGAFRNSLLNEEIYKTKGVQGGGGTYRDFLDLEGLFSYLIPYLAQANQYVYGYTDIYGRDSYDLGKVTPPSVGDDGYEEYNAKLEHNKNLQAIWMLYSPWVDQLYAGKHVSETVKLGGKSVVVGDTLNPSTYDAVGRPMIFSDGQMKALSYKTSDLTVTELKMQQVLEETYRDMMYLINYYDFDNNSGEDILLSAAAMSATFNFNRVFSEDNFLGTDVKLYPQGYELKNFNYDAFLRLILVNATGEPMLADQDLYARVLSKTSFFTGLFLLISDFLNVTAVPVAKIIILLLLFFLSFIVILYASVTEMKKIFGLIYKSILLPVVGFILATGGFMVAVSLLMGEGLTGYVGARAPTLGITDPTIVLAILSVVSIIYLILLFKLGKILYRDLVEKGGAVAFSTLAMAKTLLSGAKGALGGAMGTVGGIGGNLKDMTVKTLKYSERKNAKELAKQRHTEMVKAVSMNNESIVSKGDGGRWIENLSESPAGGQLGSSSNPLRQDERGETASVPDVDLQESGSNRVISEPRETQGSVVNYEPKPRVTRVKGVNYRSKHTRDAKTVNPQRPNLYVVPDRPKNPNVVRMSDYMNQHRKTPKTVTPSRDDS